MVAMARPLRRVRESATITRYCGLRILPRRASLILTAIAVVSLKRCHCAIQRPVIGDEPGFAISHGVTAGRHMTGSGEPLAHCARRPPRAHPAAPHPAGYDPRRPNEPARSAR